VVAAEGIEPSERDLLEALTATAEREGKPPEEVLARVRSSGLIDELREDLAARQAFELIAAQARPIGIEQARAREQLWTPAAREGGAVEAPARLWTPRDRDRPASLLEESGRRSET
jgi:hypothetical protein